MVKHSANFGHSKTQDVI